MSSDLKELPFTQLGANSLAVRVHQRQAYCASSQIAGGGKDFEGDVEICGLSQATDVTSNRITIELRSNKRSSRESTAP